MCSIPDCGRPVVTRGWCKRHYTRWHRYGDPLFMRAPLRELSAPARFWAKVNKTESCWLWTAATQSSGHGHVRVAGRDMQAHRYSYELVVGPIPDGLVLDHLCLTPACVNPDHLEPVTHPENTRRHAALTTHCPRSHPYDEENTYWHTGHRFCRTCNRERQRDRRAARNKLKGAS